MSITKEKEFNLLSGDTLKFSVCDNKLLFMHSDFISSQFELDEVGVQVSETPTSCKVAFLFKESQHYFSYYFKVEEFGGLVRYFRDMGYPVPVIPFIKVQTTQSE